MRADRLLASLLLLQMRRRITARELAEYLEVSERTVHRDMESLAMAGIPIYAVRGRGGGWILPDDFRMELPGLTVPEIRALFLGASDRLLSDLGLASASEAGSVKLLAALPASHRADAEYARQRIHVDGAGWHGTSEPVPFLPLLQEAIWGERTVRLTYQRGDHTVVDRVVDPLGLVAKRTTWYVVANVEGDIRTFRVSRVLAVTPLEERFGRPPGFDLAAYWQRSSAEFVANLPRYPATLRVAPAALKGVREAAWFAHIEREDAPHADGWTTLRVRFEVVEEACRFILSFGPHIEVLAPDELREKVMQDAKQILDLYIHPQQFPVDCSCRRVYR